MFFSSFILLHFKFTDGLQVVYIHADLPTPNHEIEPKNGDFAKTSPDLIIQSIQYMVPLVPLAFPNMMFYFLVN